MIVVTGCANVTTNVPLSSPTAGTGETTPTLKPTESPATPTETRDPNMPPGATGKDAQGNYVKIENGVQVAWNAELNTYERHVMVNDVGVQLLALTSQAHSNGVSDQLFLHVNISDKLPGFEKVESLSFHNGAGDSIGQTTFADVFMVDLQKVLQKNMGFAFHDFRQFMSGEFSLSFTTAERSQPWVWKLGPNTTVVVDIIDAPIGPGFQTWKDAEGYTFQTRLFTDEQGNLHVWVVPEIAQGTSIDQYSREELMKMYLFGVASVVADSDQTTQHYTQKLSLYAILAAKPNESSFDFGPQQ